MKKYPSSPLLGAWLDCLAGLGRSEPELHVAIRKMFRNVEWTITGEVWETGIPADWTQMGYAGASKLRQLERVYLEEQAAGKLNTVLRERIRKSLDQTSVSMQVENDYEWDDHSASVRMGHGSKHHHSQGYCMQSIVVSQYQKKSKSNRNQRIYINVYYRSTEITQKFLADLKFLHERVFPLILEGVEGRVAEVTFYFANLYLSCLFHPIIYQWVSPSEWCEILSVEPVFHRKTVQALRKLLPEKHNYSFQTQAKMQDFFRKRVKRHLTPTELRQIRLIIKETLG